MAGSSLLTLLDDIATLLDDISVMGKVAAKKTAGVLGDDLSLNAQQVSGVRANRELPVVWGVAKGSFINKLILVPLALVISALASWAVTPLLMLGGAYLCFEGMEKVIHSLQHKENSPQARQARLETFANADPAAYERDKIKGAIRTDFILSAEIVAITLGIVAQAPLLNRILILAGIAILVTIGVYGIVGIIVKIDDVGYWLQKRSSKFSRGIGAILLTLAPGLMKLLSIVGTLAMFLVGGGIVVHGIAPLHHWLEALGTKGGAFGEYLVYGFGNLLTGMILGGVVLGVVSLIGRIRGSKVG